MPIELGIANRLTFSSPIELRAWIPPQSAGLYAILTLTSGLKFMPDQWNLIYLGETGNFSERGFPACHHAYSRWVEAAGSSQNLFVAIFRMPLSTQLNRQLLERQLIEEYRPLCNKAVPLNPFGF